MMMSILIVAWQLQLSDYGDSNNKNNSISGSSKIEVDA